MTLPMSYPYLNNAQKVGMGLPKLYYLCPEPHLVKIGARLYIYAYFKIVISRIFAAPIYATTC